MPKPTPSSFMIRPLLLATFSLLGGCAMAPADLNLNNPALAPNTAITSTAAASNLIVLSRTDGRYICAQPAPDATYDSGISDSLSLSLPTNERGANSLGSNANEIALGGRTPTLLMTRELMYRTCEFSNNQNLNKTEATALFTQVLKTIAAGWATEAANTKISVGERMQAESTGGGQAGALTTGISTAGSSGTTTTPSVPSTPPASSISCPSGTTCPPGITCTTTSQCISIPN